MISTLLPALLLLAGHLGVSQADNVFAGQGYIKVIQGDDVNKADTTKSVGCMSETGAFVLSDCAVFTKTDYKLSSRLGKCTFNDPAQAANVDSPYGQRSYGWVCGPGVDDSNDLYYSQDWISGPIICHGNLDCYADVKGLPKAGDKLPLWAFYTGAQQIGVTPGHTQVMWLFVPVKSS